MNGPPLLVPVPGYSLLLLPSIQTRKNVQFVLVTGEQGIDHGERQPGRDGLPRTSALLDFGDEVITLLGDADVIVTTFDRDELGVLGVLDLLPDRAEVRAAELLLTQTDLSSVELVHVDEGDDPLDQ
jgi:hypothetical protein